MLECFILPAVPVPTQAGLISDDIDSNMTHENREFTIIFLSALIVLATSQPAVAQKAEFYGLELPGPATLQALDFEDVDFRPIANPHSDRESVSVGDDLHGHVEAFVDFALRSRGRNPQRWGIFSGFPEEESLFDYLRRHLAGAGVGDLELKVFDQAPFSLTTRWSLKVFDPDGEAVELQSSVPMGVGNRSSVEDVSAPMIYLGRGSAADLAGREAAGRIAVIRGEASPPFYDLSTRGSMARLADAGAEGVIRLWDTPGNMQLQLGDCPEISCFNLGGEDSAFLEALIAAAGTNGDLDRLRVSMEIHVERSVRKARNMVGRIRGSEPDGENIILMAHGDTWYSGADDNGSGLAVLLGLADYFGQPDARPQHDIYFVISAGHHHGQGGTSFFVEEYPQLIEDNIVTINLEHVASTGIGRIDANLMDGRRDPYGNIVNSMAPTNWDSPWHGVAMSEKTPFLVEAWRRASQANLYSQPASVWEPVNRTVPGEAAAVDAAGAIVIQNAETSHWYHTSGATAATVSPQSLARAFGFFKDMVTAIDSASKAGIRKSRAE